MNYLSTNLNNHAIEKKKRISSRVLSFPSLKKKKKENISSKSETAQREKTRRERNETSRIYIYIVYLEVNLRRVEKHSEPCTNRWGRRRGPRSIRGHEYYNCRHPFRIRTLVSLPGNACIESINERPTIEILIPEFVLSTSGDSGSADGCVAMVAPTLAWEAQDCTLVKDFICEQTRCYYYNYGSIPVSATQG